ncbi:MAG: replication-associated recombination protein A [Deltaproteobacteria bacterium]|jgi:putative ATPase|nr:replication-associated recombination protein A [Deltaproteobacteria bacterium]MBW1874356.1 replication-associated recombination protein A [Deltaproteobacteria bacterium]MBW2209857.1 replication-associated recombination protein A [Deltaproteobacteria bacterium]MBW2212994.1 replication-associated recombination protein A [Deltaproteobacteria bacterium]MBW2550140.1 replication-associated recombination protein A [Deltaproteobacteria bacterium]
MRPNRIEDVVGQAHLLGDGHILARAIRSDRIPSMILWGPPGTGKTTLAHVIANETNSIFVPFSAVLGGVPELRKIIAAAKEQKNYYGKKSILFIDEIHRFNKAQQDALLPHVENGTVTLIGATTENPSFAVNSALLSRARVFDLKPLEAADLRKLLERALADGDHGVGHVPQSVDDDALAAISQNARGDARRALSALELASDFAQSAGVEALTVSIVQEALATQTLLYDKSGEEHYNVISAFIKSMRGSDPDAAVYWLMRMLEAGEDPLFVLRRMLIFASEDIGNADPRALEVTVSADAAFRRLGMPEGIFPIAQCCVYLASAPKSNASYKAWKMAQSDVREHGALPVPLKLRNAPTEAMKSWGYGEGYRYPHDESGFSREETYLPDQLVDRKYYRPTDHGFEARIRERLRELRSTPNVKGDGSGGPEEEKP